MEQKDTKSNRRRQVPKVTLLLINTENDQICKRTEKESITWFIHFFRTIIPLMNSLKRVFLRL